MNSDKGVRLLPAVLIARGRLPVRAIWLVLLGLWMIAAHGECRIHDRRDSGAGVPRPADAATDINSPRIIFPQESPLARSRVACAGASPASFYASALSFAVLAQIAETDPEELAAVGRRYLRGGELKKALSCFRRATRLAPDNAQYFRALGEAALGAQRANEAKYAYGRALALEPGSTEAVCGLARAHMATGDHIIAAETLRPFAQKADAAPELLKLIVEAYDATGLEHEAHEMRARLAAKLPGPEEAALRRKIAKYYMDGRLWIRALQQLQKAALAHPQGTAGYIDLARCYRAVAKAGRTIDSYRLIPGVDVEKDAAHEDLAVTLTPHRSYLAALAAIGFALKRDPANAEALRTGAAAAVSAGRLERAQGYLRRLLARDPADLEARMDLVEVMVRRGHPGKALLEAGEALRAADPPVEARVRLAELAEKASNYELAIAQWRAVVGSGGKQLGEGTLKLGTLLVRSHRVGEAIRFYREALEAPGDHPALQLGLARAYQSIGHHRQAAQILAELTDDAAHGVEARVALAESLAWLGECEQAQEQIRQVIEAGAVGERALRVMALVGELGGDVQWAISELRQLLPGGALEEVILALITGLCRDTGETAAAGQRLLEIFEANPQHLDIGMAAGELLGEAGDLIEAEHVLRGVAQRSSHQKDALALLAGLHLTGGEVGRGLMTMRELLELGAHTGWLVSCVARLETQPQLFEALKEPVLQLLDAELCSAEFWVSAAALADALGRLPTALSDMRQVAGRSPGDAAIAVAVAALALHNEQPQIALAALQRVPVGSRDDHAFLHTLARAQAQLGMTEEAIGSLRQAMSGGRAEAPDHILFAELERRAGRPEERFWHLIRALRLAPGNDRAGRDTERMIVADEIGLYTIVHGLQDVYSYHPGALVVDQLMSAVGNRPDGESVRELWAATHGRADSSEVSAPAETNEDAERRIEPPETTPGRKGQSGLIRLAQ